MEAGGTTAGVGVSRLAAARRLAELARGAAAEVVGARAAAAALLGSELVAHRAAAGAPLGAAPPPAAALPPACSHAVHIARRSAAASTCVRGLGA